MVTSLNKIFISFYFYSNLLFILISAYIKLVFKKYSWKEYIKHSKKILELVKKCGAEIQIEGEENLKDVKIPLVFISNHMSSLETLIFGYLIGRYLKFTFIVKKSLLNYPIFGRLLKFTKPISVSRKNPKVDFRDIIRSCKELFKEKISIVVFPQATRMYVIDENKFNSLGIKIAKIFNVGVIPIFVKTDFWKIGKIIRDIGGIDPKKKVIIKFFPYISAQNITNATHKKIIEIFQTTYQNFLK